MFIKSSPYYDAIYDFKDYGEASSRICRLAEELHPSAATLLDIACGTGRHLEHLQSRFQVEGLDLNPELLKAARARCPNVPFHLGDMRDFNLNRRFDVITCLFSSIGYVKSVRNLRRTVRCIAEHLSPGGLVFMEPWFTPDSYWTNTITANHVDQPDLKIAWMYVSKRRARLSILDIHYMIGTPGGISRFRERHEIGLFHGHEYEGAFRRCGLSVTYDSTGLFNRGLYIASAQNN